jgi:hypothetical protein
MIPKSGNLFSDKIMLNQDVRDWDGLSDGTASKGAVMDGKRNEHDTGISLTEEQKRKRRNRSVALAVVLAALVVLFYAITLVKGPGVMNRPL